jgi:endonuclease/exonuclease/phosphatase family metal-dependent hydrolase
MTHPLPPAVNGQPPPVDTTQPLWSWRGVLDKAMRLDYTLVSSSLVSRVTEATILGSATDTGAHVGFFGSDHCPVLLTLSEAEAEDATHLEPAPASQDLSDDLGNEYDTE